MTTCTWATLAPACCDRRPGRRADLRAPLGAANAVTAAVVILGTSAVLARRWHAAAPRARRVLAPLYAYGIAAVVSVSFAANLYRLVPADPITVFQAQVGVLAGIPVAFAAGVLLGGFARTAETEELAAWLGTADRRRDELGDALARTLGDPSVQLVLRTDDGWIDAAGDAAELPADHVPVRLGKRTVGAIGYDTTLLPDPAVVDTAGRVVAIAVDRERLTAQLLAGQEQLRESRTRLVEAGDRERRRLAQDLHDRLQGRLVLLALRVGTLPGGDDVEQVRLDVDAVLTELRMLVQDVMPALLIERGLAAAVEDVLERAPLRTALDVTDDGDGSRLPGPVEGTAFFVVSEAVTNAVKHADAERLRVGLHRRAGVLHVDVDDDGNGGAAPGGGAGLRGIADRVDALGGRLHLDSPSGGGTRLHVEIPCAS
ncbi:hypothetical protein GCM10017691_61870 [Pseudonocardia petroleophila]|uniref:histidine kinase n=1 Tax=Pseudonocardia petroleophila TaxID=37331 RepID=A0A7G7MM29_9PSEU|nr:ATP-binding protein [Pseudonocardia petroleophila]QNG53840.1 sensor histidine kinase [Pseudonocardia petroleophila]